MLQPITRLFDRVDKRNVLVITIVSLAIRLVILPWSQTVQADAVSRVYIALSWLQHPHYITDGYWGPLHHYSNALFLWITDDLVVGPKLLNIILASLTVLPLYGFAKSVFRNRNGAVFVSLIYIMAPIVMRNSFQALSGVSYAFYVVTSMFFLAEGLRQNGNLKYAAIAGFAITLAAATRYEAWVVIAAFTLVAFLHKQWRFTAVFWFFAMLFPGSWMIGNQIEFGDFLYSVNQNDVWNIQREGINDSVDSVLLTQRLIFFPLSFLQNTSPITVGFILFGLGWSAYKRRLSKSQVLWLIPFLIMAAIFMQKAYAGTLMLQNRFTITWVVLLLPFAALVFDFSRYKKLRLVLAVFAVVTLFPMSYAWSLPKYKEWFGESNLALALDHLVVANSQELESVPRLRIEDTQALVNTINSHQYGSGLVLDFIGWDRTFYVSLRSPMYSYVTNGSKYGGIDFEYLNSYLNQNPKGLIMLSRIGRLIESAEQCSYTLGWTQIDKYLSLRPVSATFGERIFEYDVIGQSQFNEACTDSVQIDLFDPSRNEAFFKQLICSDMPWYNNVKRSAFWRGESIDTALAKNARHMVRVENENK